LVSQMLARRREPKHPVAQISGGHRRAQSCFELVPGGGRFELATVGSFELELRARRIAAQLQPHAADANRAANLHFRAIATLLPVEGAGAAVLRARHAET